MEWLKLSGITIAQGTTGTNGNISRGEEFWSANLRSFSFLATARD